MPRKPGAFPSYPYQMLQNIQYGTNATWHLCDVIYRNPVDTSHLRPIFVMVHGGGWQGNDKQYSWAQTVYADARRQFVTFTINYPLCPPGGPSNPRFYISDCLDGLYQFVQWLVKNAATYGGDINRVIFNGESAGAHMVMHYALTRGYNQTFVPACIQACAGAYKLDDQVAGAYDSNVTNGTGYATPQLSINTPEDWYLLSPYYQLPKYASRQMPQIYLYHELGDNIAPVAQSREMDAQLTAYGIAHTYREYPNAAHAWSAWNDIGFQCMYDAISSVSAYRGPH